MSKPSMPPPSRPRGVLPAALLPCLFGTVLSASPAAPPSLEDCLTRLQGATTGFTSLQAQFTQTRSYPQLQMVDPAELGVLYIDRSQPQRRPRVRLDITAPRRTSATWVDGDYVYYQPELNQVILGSARAEPQGMTGAGPLAFLLGDVAKLRTTHTIALLGLESRSDRQAVHLRLVPRDGGGSPYAQAEVWIDTTVWLPLRTEWVEVNGTVTQVELDQLRLDSHLDDRLFHLALPQGVERVSG